MESCSFKVSGTFRQQSAFTLIELLITLVIVTIVSALAVSAMNNLLLRQKMTVNVNNVVADLALARSEAIKRSGVVTLCQSSDGASCTGSANWHQGYLVFTDDDNDHRVDAGEAVLRKQTGFEGSARYNGTHDHYIRYQANGAVYPAGSFTFCDTRGSSGARSIIVFRTGRARTASKTADGATLVCPTG